MPFDITGLKPGDRIVYDSVPYGQTEPTKVRGVVARVYDSSLAVIPFYYHQTGPWPELGQGKAEFLISGLSVVSRYEQTGKEIIDGLTVTRPDVVIKVVPHVDLHFRWDGDGPDPSLESPALYPHTVHVDAVTIQKGREIVGRSTLGGCYFRPGEAPGEVHGYLPQMVKDAVADLDIELRGR